MITISNLKFHYPNADFALQIDKLKIESGEKVALVGPSGSGKTTLLHLIAGILLPQEGEIQIGETSFHRMSDADLREFRLNHLGLIFQEFELIEYLNVQQNLLLPAKLQRSDKAEEEAQFRILPLAKKLGIEDKLKAHPKSLSTGEKQRVAIIRALLSQPKTLLVDEPTSSLDEAHAELVIQLFDDYCETQNATLILLTHDTRLLQHLDRVIDVQQFRTAYAEGANP